MTCRHLAGLEDLTHWTLVFLLPSDMWMVASDARCSLKIEVRGRTAAVHTRGRQALMRHIEIAESFARAVRQAEAGGDYRKAAKLFAEAVKVLKSGPHNLSHFAEVPPWTTGVPSWTAGRDRAMLPTDDVSPPPSTVRR